MSLGATGSVGELLDHNARVVKSHSELDRPSGLQLHLGALCGAIGKTGNADDEPMSAGTKPGSTLNHCRAVWENQPLFWKPSWFAWKSLLEHIVQWFLKPMYSVCILINVSIYLYHFPTTHRISGLAIGCAWEEFEVHLKMMINYTQSYTWRWLIWELRDTIGGPNRVRIERCTERPMWTDFRDSLGGHNRSCLEMHLKAIIEQT